MARELFKTVIVFDKDLPEEKFHRLETEIAKTIVEGCDTTRVPIPSYLHQVKGFGNTKIRKGEQTYHGWCTYFYYTTEKERADEIFRLLQRSNYVTIFETVILKGEAASKVNTNCRIDVNAIHRTYLKKQKNKDTDYFDLIFC